ncbi:unnamed protein product [Phytophthora fragariaefolia]|uniref:Unnamed protein product n=1 Tax=Phytophthora fragariaefolia TaxID=1490495 RepID=A0A9W6XR20_9STRA|nr:unnamed protein product [Phytophthora fragariaefolia]
MHPWLPTAPHINVNDSFPHQSPPLNDSNIRVGYPSTPASGYFVRQSFNEDYTLARQNPMGIIRNTTYLVCTGSSMEHSFGIAATQVNRLMSVPDSPSNPEGDIRFDTTSTRRIGRPPNSTPALQVDSLQD